MAYHDVLLINPPSRQREFYEPFFKKFGPSLRMRSSANVIEELEFLSKKYGVRNVDFNDANFIGGKGRGARRANL